MLVGLLADVDLPQIQAEFEASGVWALEQLSAVRTMVMSGITNSKISVEQAQPILAFNREYQRLFTLADWVKLLVYGYQKGDLGSPWVEVAEASIAQHGHQLVHLMENQFRVHPPNWTTIHALLRSAVNIGLPMVDLIFHNMPAWNMLLLTTLFRMHRFPSSRPTWVKSGTYTLFTPALLTASLDKILGLDSDPTARQLSPSIMHIMVHVVAKQFDICVRTLAPHTEPSRQWLASLSPPQRALLFACVWSALPNSDPLWPGLFSHAAQDVIGFVPAAAGSSSSSPNWHSLLPAFLLAHVRNRIQRETSAAVDGSSEDSLRDQCRNQESIILSVDREWVVQALKCQTVDQAFMTAEWE